MPRLCCCILVLLPLTFVQPPLNAPTKLKLTIEPTAEVFDSPKDVILRLTIWNTEEDCWPIIFDPVLYPDISEARPFTEVKLEFIDTSGELADRGQQEWLSSWGRFRPVLLNLAPLNCGTFYGEEIKPTVSPWNFKLIKGTYHVRVTLKMRVRSFIKARPDLIKALAEEMGWSDENEVGVLLPLLAEGVFQSEATIVISNP